MGRGGQPSPAGPAVRRILPGQPRHEVVIGGQSAAMAARSMGVEEELLLVEPGTGLPLAVAESVLNGGEPAQTLDDRETPAGKETPEGNRRPGADAGEESLEFELQQQQLETNSKPCDDLGELSEQVRRAVLDRSLSYMIDQAAEVTAR